MSHKSIAHSAWDALRDLYRAFRATVAPADEHDGPAIVVPGPIEAVEAALGREYFAPNWEFSYYERGEDLNLARVEYDEQEIGEHVYVWWQVHVRGWEQDNGSVRLRPHWELEPTEYDQDHIDGVGFSTGAGLAAVAAALERQGLVFEKYDHIPAGG